MVKRTVESLFKLPSMSNSYLAAGERGILKEIKRIDILEKRIAEMEKGELPDAPLQHVRRPKGRFANSGTA